MEKFKLISIIAYLVGILFWFVLWKLVIGYEWLKKEPNLHFPLWGGCFVLLINLLLTWFSATPSYEIEIGIYAYVERNGITVAGFGMAIAVFVVLKFKDSFDVLKNSASKKFLQLVFTSFLIVVLGVLPLYWIPQIDGWLTVLRNLKTIPYLYSLFILASAIVIYLHIFKEDKRYEAKDKNE